MKPGFGDFARPKSIPIATEYVGWYNTVRPHQGIGNVPIGLGVPVGTAPPKEAVPERGALLVATWSKSHPWPLPKNWPAKVKQALLTTIYLATAAVNCSRAWCANSPLARVKLNAELLAAQDEIALLNEEIRIKNARLAAIDPRLRPQYPPVEQMAILELKTRRGWSNAQTARVFHLTARTIGIWLKRLDEEGPDALVQVPVPMNKFPDFVRHAVQRLKTLCPQMGKIRVAQTLARAGVHLASICRS